MAVIQISRIQHRRGLRSELPEALGEGEFGLATDTGEVFMGAPNLDKIQHRKLGGSRVEGIFPYTNIRLLTEFDVSYTLTGAVYTQGPLLRATLPTRMTSTGATVASKTVGVEDPKNSDVKTLTLNNILGSRQDGAVVMAIAVNPSTAKERLLEAQRGRVSGANVVLDLSNTDVTINNGDVVRISYLGAQDMFEFLLEDADSGVIDYSAIADTDPVASGEANPKSRRTGTLRIIADMQDAAVQDTFVQLHPETSGVFLAWGARVVASEDGNTHRVVITCVNAGEQALKVTFSGKRWSSTF
jgi:hypothetical protein